ncbi:cupin domain-containing protein [soil metagenome]
MSKFDARAVQSGEGKQVRIVQDTVRFVATGEQTGGAFSLFDNFTPPGGGIPPHFHTNEDESFWVIEGTFRFLLGDETVELGPGCFVQIPRGTVHSFENIGDETGRMLIQTTPGGFDEFFAEAGDPIVPDEELGPPEVERVIAIAAEHGIEFLPPPAED